MPLLRLGLITITLVTLEARPELLSPDSNVGKDEGYAVLRRGSVKKCQL